MLVECEHALMHVTMCASLAMKGNASAQTDDAATQQRCYLIMQRMSENAAGQADLSVQSVTMRQGRLYMLHVDDTAASQTNIALHGM
eukprot:scaffold211195_cov21-Tisochrysis_lutea.AAC.1